MKKSNFKGSSACLGHILYGSGGITLLLVWSSYHFVPKEFGFYLIAFVWLLGVYGYFRSKNKTMWIKLDDEAIEYNDSASKLFKKHHYKDIESISNYWGGFELRLKKGNPEKKIQIGTSPFKNSRELKTELIQRWQKPTQKGGQLRSENLGQCFPICLCSVYGQSLEG